MEDTQTIYWLIAGLSLIFLEVSLATGIGLLFAGLAACLVAIMLQLDWLTQDAILWQFIWFFALTGAWALLLWVPLRRFQSRNKLSEYQNIVGNRVVVVTPPAKLHSTFKVMWSGARVKAQLDETATALPAQDDELEVTDVKGNLFIVKTL